MPHYDLASIPATALMECDVCIIGSGPAGATIARELSDTGIQVTIVESGGLERHPEIDALDHIEDIGRPRVPDQWLVRNRILGGSSHTWTGKCAPFDGVDFEARDWVKFSGWPFSSSEIAPYFSRAAPYLGLNPGAGYGDQFWQFAGRVAPHPTLEPERLESFFWQYSRDAKKPQDYMRFGPRLLEHLGANVTLLTRANVVAINVNEDATAATSVDLAAADGKRCTLAARNIVLCAGGIENARILLASNKVVAAGVGNRHGQVGRYLMDHLRGTIGLFKVKGAETVRKWYGHYRIKTNHVFAHGLRISPTVQRHEQLLNCAAWIAGDVAADDPWNAIKYVVQRQPNLRTHLAAIASNFGLLVRGLDDYFIRRNGWPRKIDRLNLIGMCEQQPDPDSRVTLAATKDRFGVPHSRIDWRVHDSESRSLRRMGELVVEQFSRVGIEPPQLEPWMLDRATIPLSFQDVAHPTGTTRMGNQPETSVVDPNCQVHGMHGLHIAGSSVFPTSGHANPTQMIVALALRLADRIKVLHQNG